MMTDYRELLKGYMQYVHNEEGWTFLENGLDKHNKALTSEEFDELVSLAKEAGIYLDD